MPPLQLDSLPSSCNGGTLACCIDGVYVAQEVGSRDPQLELNLGYLRASWKTRPNAREDT